MTNEPERVVSGWQPIETAPKDLAFRLCYFGTTAGEDACDLAICQRRRDGWYDDRGDVLDEPTHWMSLPDPPTGDT